MTHSIFYGIIILKKLKINKVNIHFFKFHSFSLSAIIFVTVVFFIFSLNAAFAIDMRAPDINIVELREHAAIQQKQSSFLSFGASETQGGTIAVGDVNGDGQKEIVVAAGPFHSPMVRVFTANGVKLSEFLAYDENMNAGVNVAIGDLDGDGTDEIVTGPGKGNAPQIKIFNDKGKALFASAFFAFGEKFMGGGNVAVGNVDGKKGDEIIVGAGPGGGGQVRIFHRDGTAFPIDFWPFAESDHGGVTVAAANVDGGKESEIVVAMQTFGEPWVKVYKFSEQKQILGEFLAYDANYHGGVVVAGGDVDKDGRDEVITSARQGGAPHIRFFKGHGKVRGSGFLAYEDDFRGGVSIAVANIDSDSKPELITMPMRKIVEGRLDLYKYIEVDISDQKLRAYRNGAIDREFLISSGIDKYPTPTGETTISAKILSHDYEWTYGPDNPDNYDLPDVPYNLRFRPRYYIHNAYWHNNFGHKMSHGCVNVNLENAKWIYDWADVGDTVVIRE